MYKVHRSESLRSVLAPSPSLLSRKHLAVRVIHFFILHVQLQLDANSTPVESTDKSPCPLPVLSLYIRDDSCQAKPLNWTVGEYSSCSICGLGII